MLDAENCGEPSHVRRDKDDSHPGASFIPNRRRRDRPSLTVNEEYELFDDLDVEDRGPESDRAWPDLNKDSFDSVHLQVGIKAQKAFTAHHHVEASVAISEIRVLAGYAISRGQYLRYSSGFHRLEAKKFKINITPDGRMVTNYATRHFERTPSQVIGGVTSRFGSKENERRKHGPPRTLDQIRETLNATETPVSSRAMASFARRMGLDKKLPETELSLRQALLESVATGHWKPGDRPGAFLIESHPWVWLIAADDATILSVWPIDDPERSAG